MKLNLHNKTLKVGLNISPPYVFLEMNPISSIWEGRGGFELKLIDTLKDYFNFQYNLINCNSTWGSRLPNGTWTGVIGLLNKEEADVGIGGITLNYDRSEAVSFLYPHVVSTVTFITPGPKIQPNIYLVFKPLALNVWFPFIFTLFLAIIFDRLYNRIHPNKNYVKVFWIGIHSMFRQQYNGKIADHPSLNIWNTFWSIATFILTTGYAGCLCSLITIPIKMKTIDTCQELGEAAKAKKIMPTAIANSAYADALKMSKMPIYMAISKYMNLVPDKREGLDLVRLSTKKINYAFISTRDYLRFSQLIYGEDVIYLPPENEEASLFMDLITVLVKPSFLYVQEFNKAINNLMSAGLINYWKEQEYFRISKKQTSGRSNDETNANGSGNNNENSYNDNSLQELGFSISQLQSFFYVFILSILISITGFLFEVIHYFAKGKMDRKKVKRSF